MTLVHMGFLLLFATSNDKQVNKKQPRGGSPCSQEQKHSAEPSKKPGCLDSIIS